MSDADGMIDTGFLIGLDLGQSDDFTALTVVQRLEARPPAVISPRGAAMGWRVAQMTAGPVHDGNGGLWQGTHYVSPRMESLAHDAMIRHYRLGHIERLRRVPYPDIVDKVMGLMRRPELAAGGTREAPQLVVDATGVGRPVVDLFRKAKLNPIAVTITGGDLVGHSGGGLTVPKRDLVAALTVMLQTGRLKIQQGLPHAATLQQELMDFRVKISAATAHDSYNARDGEHDDLVLAAALACWYGERPRRRPYTDYPVIQR